MKTIIFSLVLAIFLVACSSSRKTTTKVSSHTITKADILKGGVSFENAIVIKVEKEGPGVAEEYKWLAISYPGYSTIRKAQASRIKKHYDIITIRTKDGQEKDIYFDITSFFGKG